MRCATLDKTLRESIYVAGFLLYDLKDSSIIFLKTSEESRDLKIEKRISIDLKDIQILPRDVYSCVVLDSKEFSKIIF